MANKNAINKFWQIAEPIAESLDSEIVDIEWRKEGIGWVLRVFLDREKAPVDHSLCENFSRQFSFELDNKNSIEHNYNLEVSSPGIERPLRKEKDFIRFTGETVKITLYAPQNGRKNFKGELLGLENGNVKLILDDAKPDQQEASLPFKDIAKAQTVWVD